MGMVDGCFFWIYLEDAIWNLPESFREGVLGNEYMGMEKENKRLSNI
jgi:hypothetical protein